MFNQRLKQLRESKGLTQSQLAEELSIGRASISNYELNSRIPDLDVLVKIADYFGVTIDYLAGKSNFKDNKSQGMFSKEELEIFSKIDEKIATQLIERIETLKKVLLNLCNQDIHPEIINSIFKSLNLLFKFYAQLELIKIDKVMEIQELIKNSTVKTESPMTIIENYLNQPINNSKEVSFTLSEIINELTQISNEVQSESNSYAVNEILTSLLVKLTKKEV